MPTLVVVARRLLRLVVPTPDRRRVLARPNGLAGWALPVAALDDLPPGAIDPLDAPDWPPGATDAAGRAVGVAVTPVRKITDGAWEVMAQDRIPRAGTAWIAPEEAGRLGADAAILLAWVAAEPTDDDAT